MSSAGCRSALVVSDVHLSRRPNRGADALARLLETHPEHEVFVAGDLFDLALDPPSKDSGESIAEILSSHRRLSEVLVMRLQRGVPVNLLAGNHDAAVAETGVRDKLLSKLGLPAGVPLSTFPWFVRRQGVHIEHGHFYDPDNAPTHPLCPWSYETEPLGIAMTRRFVAPNGAMMFAGAHETTPLAGLYQVLRSYRLRAPMVIVDYFATAFGLCLRARTQRRSVEQEFARGAVALLEHCQRVGIEASVVHELLGEGARPTHHGVRSTFMRLYFDRIFATFGGVAGSVAGFLGNPYGLALSGLSALYLLASVKGQGSRYQDLPPARLRAAAEKVRRASAAHTVIFGHSHVEDSAPGYMNLGSFSFANLEGRPYAEIDAEGSAKAQRFSSG
jgi:predicted phosphodiesterase